MHKKLIFITSFIISLVLLSSGCEPHKIDVQQGNKIKPSALAKLKTGMSRKQVLYVLGTPLLKDPFHQDRWDYIYYLKPGNDTVKRSRVTLYFKGDKLIRIDDSAYAPEMHGDSITGDLDENDLPPTLNPRLQP